MRKIILAGCALVASVQPVSAKDSELPSGPYVGVQVGGARVQDKHSDIQGWYNGVTDFGMNKGGVIGGARIGYDFVINNYQAGVMAEANFGTLDTFAETSKTWTEYKIGSRTTLLGSVRAKLGLRAGKTTFHANGGWAFSNSRHRYAETDGSGQYFSDKGSQSGWVGGFGIDQSIGAHTSIGILASHYQFSQVDHVLLEANGTPSACTWSPVASPGNLCHFPMRDHFETVTVAFNYHF